MNKKHIIFCDANVIFGLLKRIVQDESIFHSALMALAKEHNVWVSEFVLNEVIRSLRVKYDLQTTQNHLLAFKSLTNFQILQSEREIATHMIHYVHDIMDTPVLQDAVAIHADYLLTHNIKDFDTKTVLTDFGIRVVATIPQELFS